MVLLYMAYFVVYLVYRLVAYGCRGHCIFILITRISLASGWNVSEYIL
jgi:hypothetical protein